jgi:hypothetical protein
MVGKAHSFLGHPVYVRRLDYLLSEAAQVPVAQIVGEDENDIRAFSSCPGCPAYTCAARQQRRRSH